MLKRNSISPLSASVALLASLLLHACALLAVLWSFSRPQTLSPHPAPIEAVQILSEEEVSRILARHEPKPQPEKPQPEKDKKPDPPKKKNLPLKGQVVEIPPPKDEQVPDVARFLAEYNSKVEREQQSADHNIPTPQVFQSDRTLVSSGRDPNGQQTAPLADPKQPQSAQQQQQHEQNTDAQKPAKERQQQQVAQSDHPTELNSGEGPFKVRHPRKNEAVANAGPMSGSPNPVDLRSLLPSLGPREMALHTGSIDHIEDVDRGAETFLNTVQFKHAWFFNRVKNAVAQKWHPNELLHRHDPHGQVNGVRDRFTLLRVTIDSTGELTQVEVSKSCGIGYLDDHAIWAFKQAAPFPHPPAELMDQQNKISFNFGFFLETYRAGFF